VKTAGALVLAWTLCGPFSVVDDGKLFSDVRPLVKNYASWIDEVYGDGRLKAVVA
jgi:hypothetical protein